MPTLTSRGRCVRPVLPQQRCHVSKSLFNIQTACRKDLVWRLRSHLQARRRSSSVEFGRSLTIVAISIVPALIPMQSAGSRATFPSRGPTFGGRARALVTAEMLGTFRPSGHRNRAETLSTGGRP